jgi:hypothetical protein
MKSLTVVVSSIFHPIIMLLEVDMFFITLYRDLLVFRQERTEYSPMEGYPTDVRQQKSYYEASPSEDA